VIWGENTQSNLREKRKKRVISLRRGRRGGDLHYDCLQKKTKEKQGRRVTTSQNRDFIQLRATGPRVAIRKVERGISRERWRNMRKK